MNMKSVEFDGILFNYIDEFYMDNVEDYGSTSFYIYDRDSQIIVYIDDFDTETNYDDEPSSFNSETGNVRYKSYSYETLSDVFVYHEFIDANQNVISEEQFLQENPEIDNLPEVIRQAENFTKKLFRRWHENQ